MKLGSSPARPKRRACSVDDPRVHLSGANSAVSPLSPMRDLGALGGFSSYGMAINGYNHVAGYSTHQQPTTIAFTRSCMMAPR